MYSYIGLHQILLPKLGIINVVCNREYLISYVYSYIALTASDLLHINRHFACKIGISCSYVAICCI